MAMNEREFSEREFQPHRQATLSTVTVQPTQTAIDPYILRTFTDPTKRGEMLSIQPIELIVR